MDGKCDIMVCKLKGRMHKEGIMMLKRNGGWKRGHYHGQI